ncbi:MBOAT family O-acyltransferase [Clostridium culturomicium]|uniref:MBOAT family O-acyltransferase n=1 Tax=Clostridium culturomicium TaxID=1499683 RepID=UPI00385737E9
MNLISISFIVFFALSVFIYYIIPKKLQWVGLLALSIIFYLQSDPAYLIFLIFSIISTYLFAIYTSKLKNKIQKKIGLFFIIFLNIGLLFVVKFYSFGSSILNILLHNLNISMQLPSLKMIVPLGISFYTLQVIGYCIDVYREKYKAERNIFKYALFVSFFPHIIQGPIARFDQLAWQLSTPHKFEYNNVKFGLQLMLYGFFKKLVIADRVAILVNQVFNNYIDYSGLQFLIAAIFYSIQIYTDFSGCVDICRGVAQTFGINLARNFEHPYTSKSIAEFWRRWHMSLSSWFRDYIYIPLGGNRKGNSRKYLNVVIVFLVSGLWHGVGVHFIIWGLIHGMYQVIGFIIKPIKDKVYDLMKVDRNTFSFKLGQTIVTFLLTTFAWIFFRANTKQAVYIIVSIFTDFNLNTILTDSLFTLGLSWKQFMISIIGIAVLIMVSMLQKKFSIREKLASQTLWFRWSIYLTAILVIVIFGVYGPGYSGQQFIYMQF